MTRSRTSHRDDNTNARRILHFTSARKEKADVLSLNEPEKLFGGDHRGDHPRTELYLA